MHSLRRVRIVGAFIELKMPTAPKPPLTLRTSRYAQRVGQRWMLAGAAGLTVCAGAAIGGTFDRYPPAMAAVLAVASGWLVILLLAPWRLMRQLHQDQRRDLRALTDTIRAVGEGDREVPIKSLVLQRDDELGALSRAVHDLAVESMERHSQVRLLQRRMGLDIQRETRRATAHLERQALTDPLTGLGNRRALEQWVGEILDPQRRDRRTVTAIAIDLDRFKHINDVMGHEAGDRCLLFLGQVLKSNLRDGACAVRLGGDEFVVLMPDQGDDVGRVVAERLARLFAQMPWTHPTVRRPTLSFGVASVRGGEPESATELLRRADESLYSAKQAGRSPVTEFGQKRGAA